MKLALPTRKDCKYIRGKLKVFWLGNHTSKYTPDANLHEFEQALTRLFKFFQLSKPRILWCETLNTIFTQVRVLGQCTPEGEIRLLTPYFHQSNFEEWLDTFYHEIGHYVLWADTERKAREFSTKMRLR